MRLSSFKFRDLKGVIVTCLRFVGVYQEVPFRLKGGTAIRLFGTW